MYAIVVHGGAGEWQRTDEAQALTGVRLAAQRGRDLLAAGRSALEAVVEAVAVLEDDPVFNAGTGSVLGLDGEVEMDAGVMVGRDLRTGNVAALKRVRNPVRVAQRVMEDTDHVLLAGDGAFLFARACGYPDHDPVTAHRREQWCEQRRTLLDDVPAVPSRLHNLVHRFPELAGDTVGAVALDRDGVLAAATSTGGVALKLSGRVGDSPIPGAGNYADETAAVSATGQGELMMRLLTAKSVCDRVAAGMPVTAAAAEAVATLTRRFGPRVGIIALDRHGRPAIAHSTSAMPYAYVAGADTEVVCALRV